MNQKETLYPANPLEPTLVNKRRDFVLKVCFLPPQPKPGGFVTRMLTGPLERLPAIALDVKTGRLNPYLPHP